MSFYTLFNLKEVLKMFDYIGEECIVCKQKFKKGDDIVVCPDCGTPYHRECFAKNGACINLSLHENNQTWTQTVKEENKSTQNQNSDSNSANENSFNQNTENNSNAVCPFCGNVNNPGSSFCSRCGKSLDGSNENGQFKYANSSTYVDMGGKQVKIDFGDKYAGLDPEDDFEGAKVKNTAEFIGSNGFMLLVLFKKFSMKLAKVSTNLACLFFPYLYFAYRKMWKMCFATVAVLSVLSIPSFLDGIVSLDTVQYKQLLSSTVSQIPAYNDVMIQIIQKWQTMLKPYSALLNNLDVICQALIMAVRILAFLFGNYLYYRFTIKKVNNIQNTCSLSEAPARCRAEGGTSIANIFLGIVAKIAAEFVFYGIAIVLLLMNTK